MGLGMLTNGRTQEHRYQTCRDESCERFACRVWREGFREGYGAGHGAGKAEGHAEGYDEGFVDGMAACPGPHTGG
jgi:hypothetical protein